jgi:hypothetical protein
MPLRERPSGRDLLLSGESRLEARSRKGIRLYPIRELMNS